jgi:hypothetical protein
MESLDIYPEIIWIIAPDITILAGEITKGAQADNKDVKYIHPKKISHRYGIDVLFIQYRGVLPIVQLCKE